MLDRFSAPSLLVLASLVPALSGGSGTGSVAEPAQSAAAAPAFEVAGAPARAIEVRAYTP
jgi:hypothetical protein